MWILGIWTLRIWTQVGLASGASACGAVSLVLCLDKTRSHVQQPGKGSSPVPENTASHVQHDWDNGRYIFGYGALVWYISSLWCFGMVVRIDEDNIIIAIVNIVFINCLALKASWRIHGWRTLINTSIYEDHLCLQPCAGWEGAEGMKHSVNSHYSEY